MIDLHNIKSIITIGNTKKIDNILDNIEDKFVKKEVKLTQEEYNKTNG